MVQTPGTVDQYSRYMVEMFDERQLIGVPTVWQSFFGVPAHGSRTIISPDSEVVDIDIIRASEHTAALVHRGTDSRHLDNLQKNTVTQNYSSFSRVFTLAEEMGDITASQINKRVAGENPYEGRARAQRLRSLAREHHLEHIRRYVRLFEVLAGTSILGGQMPAILGTNNADLLYDWRRNAAHFITPAVPWNVAGNDIIGDIDNACETMRENGKVWPNVMFLGQSVANAFFNDSVIKEFANNRKLDFVRAGQKNPVPPQFSALVTGGAIYRGYLQTPVGYGLHIFTYVDIFTDATGNAQPYMPIDSVLLAHYGARCDRYFGPPERLPLVSSDMAWYQEMFGMNMASPVMPPNIKNMGATIMPQMFYCDAYRSGDMKKVTVRTQSAPIFATTQTDAFITLTKVVDTSVS